MRRRNADILAREHTEDAIQVITEVMNDPFAEDRDKLSAANAILDRGHGKPSQAIIAVPASKAQAALLAAMGDDELMHIVNQAQIRRLAPIDAEFEVVPAEHKDDLLK